MIRRQQPLALGGAVLLTLASGVWAAFALPAGDVAPETLARVSHGRVATTAGGHDAVAGERLRAGDTITTGAGGSATILSPGRRLLIGPETIVTVGAEHGSPTYDLRYGSIGLDVERGGAVSIRADQLMATTRTSRTELRMDRHEQVRAASLVGATEVGVPGGSTVSLGQLQEVVVIGATLPQPVPVSTVDSSPTGLDAALAPALAQAEGSYERLVRQVDADPVAPAIFGVTAGSGPVSETALPEAIGRAGTVRTVRDKVAFASSLRAQQGAWAVVAAELGAQVPAVTSALSDLLTPPGQAVAPVVITSPGAVITSPGPSPSSGAGSPSRPGSSPSPRPSSGPAPSSGGSPSSPAPPVGASPSPQPSPTPAPGLVGGLLGTVGNLLGPILGPSPSP